MLEAVAKFSGLPGLGLSVLPWLEMAALQSGLAVNVKADIPKCFKKKSMPASWGERSDNGEQLEKA